MCLDAIGCCVRDHLWSDWESNHVIAINKNLILSYLILSYLILSYLILCARLKNRCQNTPLLNALNIYKVTNVIRLEELSLFRAALTSVHYTQFIVHSIDMLTGRFQDSKCPDLWPRVSDVKGTAGKQTLSSKQELNDTQTLS